jgi:nicotinate-nucleotide pyrophosphorylase (carboxylating)
MTETDLLTAAIADLVRAALAEDLGAQGDITSAAVIPEGAQLSAEMVAREPLVVAGMDVAAAVFRALDPGVRFALSVSDGGAARQGDVLCRVHGNARALLAGERSALNIVQHLSGIATVTRRYVEAVTGTGAVLLDTRKTIPGLRVLDKYAVRMGGGTNHRMGLFDAVLIKDNHVAAAGGVGEAVRRAKAAGLAVEVEVDRLDQIEAALAAGADRLLLDNMGLGVLREAVALVRGRVPTEASGGVRLETVRAIAETGVTYVSVGRLTQSAPAVDIGLDWAG